MNQSESKNPEISWEKVYCPMCGMGTGYNTQCEKNSGKKRQLLPSKNGFLPIFSTDCVFKRSNVWTGLINYKITPALLEKLHKVDGVESIEVNSPYTFTVIIAKLFNEVDVKKSMAIIYRSYIKELLALRSGKEGVSAEATPILDDDVVGIIMPNGDRIVSESNSIEFSELLKEFSLAKPIFRKDLNHGS